MRCTVLGAGSWGTALAAQLARVGHTTVLWDRNEERCAALNRDHKNPRYLRDVPLPRELVASPDLVESVRGADLIVPVVPSHALRGVLDAVRGAVTPSQLVCCATKGIEDETFKTMFGVCESVLGGSERISVIYGPSFAKEVAQGLPTAVVVAGPHDGAQAAAGAFHGDLFRCYHTEDVVGVCIGGSIKNVMAIACGVSDGLGLGTNARAGLITRGLAEITRLATAMGANPLTLMGLAGLGDLVLTCTGDLSRNRRVGLALGQGRTLQSILDELGEVAEGVTTAISAHHLAQSVGVEMPITAQVYAMLHQGTPAVQALMDLMGRQRRAERD